MFGRLTVSACASLALLAGAAWAQSPAPNAQKSNPEMSDPQMSDQEIQHGPQKLREKLAQDGYTDVKIAPGSYIVSAKDKDGNKVVMMIGPTSMTMMKIPDNDPSEAEMPGTDKGEIIQQ